MRQVFTQKKKQQKEYKLLGSYRPKIDGGKIFQFNPQTELVTEAIFRESDKFVLGKRNNKKLDVVKGCYYVEALNMKNAIKRLKKGKVLFKA